MSLFNLFSGKRDKKNTTDKRPSCKRPLRVESLEDRRVLSATSTVLHAGDDGYVAIHSFDDSWVSYGGSAEAVQDFDLLKIVGGDANDKVVVTNNLVEFNGKVISLPDDIEIEMISFKGGNGNDTFNNITKTYSQASGGNGNDQLYGGYGKDGLSGGEGFDRLFGRAGEDWLNGGEDADWLYGGNDSDILIGDDGNDFLFGDAGDDFLTGGAGSDWLDGGFDNDSLFGDNASGWWSEETEERFGDFAESTFGTYYRMRGGPGDGNDVLDGGRQREAEADQDQLHGEGGKDTFVTTGASGVAANDFYWYEGDRTMQRYSSKYDAAYHHRRYAHNQHVFWHTNMNYYYGWNWNMYYQSYSQYHVWANYTPPI